MVQEKYNKLIFDSADEESLKDFSHLRVNALSVLRLGKEDKVLLVGVNSTAIREELATQVALVAEYTDGNYKVVATSDESEASSDKELKFTYIISAEPLCATPGSLKTMLEAVGRFAFLSTANSMSKKLAVDILKEAGFAIESSYKLSPNYLYTTEIFSDEFSQANFAYFKNSSENSDYIVTGALRGDTEDRTISDKLLYRKLSNDRNPKYSVITDIVSRSGRLVVIKRPATSEATAHIKRVFSAYEGLQETFKDSIFAVNKSELIDDAIESEFLSGNHVQADMGVDFIENLKKVYLKNAKPFVMTEQFKETFGEVEFPAETLAVSFVDIDLIFENIILQDNKWNVIDYEWTFDFPIPVNYIFYRAKKFSQLAQHLIDIPAKELECFEKMEAHFQNTYIHEGVYNIHELRKHIKGQSQDNSDFMINSRDYQIKQLKELIAAKDVHIRNITSERDALSKKYDEVTGTRGYKMLEDWRSFKTIFTGEPNPLREQKKQLKLQSKQLKKQIAKDNATNKTVKNSKSGKASKSIAVHAHLFYVDLLPEFITYFENIPCKFDLYLSVTEGTDEKAIRTLLKAVKQIQTIDIRTLPNRGRDIAPLYCKFAPEILKHDYFLHIHTKKSLYSGEEKSQWRQYCLEVLLGSKEKIDYIFELFENQNAGLIYPDIQQEIPMIAYSWLANETMSRQLLKEYGIADIPEVFNYPAGSFFWARTDALRPILEHGYTYEDFPREAGQTDGTLAHALERVIPFISRKQGYEDYILYLNQEDTCKNLSLRPFNKYFKMDKQLLTMKLGNYNVVSFDIFDTLITRGVVSPNDLFKLMGEIIAKKYQVDCDFLAIRKAAEVEAGKLHGALATIDHIYLIIANNPMIGEYAQEIKQLEIDLEFKLCMPRKDMVDVYNAVKNMGIPVILVSDMYLTKVNIVAMLHKCGITGYSDLFLSCERGGRKDDGSLWNIVFSTYSQDKFIHVGDNFRSDSQVLMDQGVESFPILSGKALMDISKFSHLLQSQSDVNRMNYKNSSCLSAYESLVLGQALNGGIFNSPFAYDENGELKYKNAYDLGYTSFGPLMASFIQWIIKNGTAKKERLLLLAREGYIIDKLIKTYCKVADISEPDTSYFLCSRRAVSVPAISNEEDLQELLTQKYDGSFSNLLSERLGIQLHPDDVDIHINYDFDMNRLFSMVEPYKQELFENVAREKNAYLNYIKEQLVDVKDVSVVDVGFSGTIQYFLMKLTGRSIGGHYLCLHTNRPEKIGGECDAIYTIKDVDKIAQSKLLRYQLFLENALSAPYGQLICFDMKDGNCVPKYKSDSSINDTVTKLQQGIFDYVTNMGNILKGCDVDMSGCDTLVENIFYDIISSGSLTEEIATELTVEDGYSKGGVQKFDVNTQAWKVE